MNNEDWLEQVKFDDAGLVPVIAQEENTGLVLMFAWMNRDSLSQTAATGKAVYWSRSRKRLWPKGEESGNEQIVSEIRQDCDGDVIILKVQQVGDIACHTGRASCFHKVLISRIDSEPELKWQTVDPVLKNPEDIYHRE